MKTVDTPRLASGSILRVARHGVGDGGGEAIDPVIIHHIMAVSTLVSLLLLLFILDR
jgi:hypothetical protein